jgi:hypothetical protein
LVKRKTTIMIDEEIWKELLSFTVQKHGTAKKTSKEIENAIRRYVAENTTQ